MVFPDRFSIVLASSRMKESEVMLAAPVCMGKRQPDNDGQAKCKERKDDPVRDSHSISPSSSSPGTFASVSCTPLCEARYSSATIVLLNEAVGSTS